MTKLKKILGSFLVIGAVMISTIGGAFCEEYEMAYNDTEAHALDVNLDFTPLTDYSVKMPALFTMDYQESFQVGEETLSKVYVANIDIGVKMNAPGYKLEIGFDNAEGVTVTSLDKKVNSKTPYSCDVRTIFNSPSGTYEFYSDTDIDVSAGNVIQAYKSEYVTQTLGYACISVADVPVADKYTGGFAIRIQLDKR